MPPSAVLTTGIGYVRLHGRGEAANWFRDFSSSREATTRNDYLYSTAELAEWRTRIDKLAQHAKRLMVVFNNDARAKSLVNAFQMQALLGQANGARVPRELVMRYPNELAGFRVNRPVQAALFPEPAIAAVA